MTTESPADAARPIQVAIVEDQRIAREGLRLIIDATPGYRCTRTYETAEDGLNGLASEPPDVLLLDIHLPGMNGSEAVPLFRERYPSVRILMLSGLSDDDNVLASICGGASGYILKKTPPAKLLEAISDAFTGGAPMSPEIARKVVNLFQKTKPRVRAEHELTPHEVRLLGLLAQGYSYQGAAEKFEVSINTVRDYVRSIYEKLHVHSKSEAVTKALRGGII